MQIAPLDIRVYNGFIILEENGQWDKRNDIPKKAIKK